MQGISKSRHVHLMDALLQLEGLLSAGKRERGCLQEASDYRESLEAMHRNYERLLDELAGQIEAYETLYSEIKVQYLGKKLKELKKEIPVTVPAFVLLQANIKTAYGT